jgi:hypothetical protein
MGLATAVNTAGSILASLLVGLWLIPAAGLDAALYLLLMLQIGVALVVLARYQPGGRRLRLASAGLAGAAAIAIAGLFGGAHADLAIAGRHVRADSLEDYQRSLAERVRTRTFLAEGKTAIVTVHETTRARELRTNGMPEAGLGFEPPYRAREAVLLGALPYLLAERSERALVIGLGGANTVDGLTRTALREIDVVELEPAVVDAVRVVYQGRPNPIDDPRVDVRVGDGRHQLLLGARGRQEGYDVIASQPSHPWLAGAAGLFTEEYFALARDNLRPGGVFSVWLNGFRTDAESVLAVLASFERVFPGSLVLEAGTGRPREALLLLGALRPIAFDVDRMRARMEEAPLRSLLELYAIGSVEQVLAASEGPTAVFAALAPDASNTDDNAFLESRIPRRLDWSVLDFRSIEDRLPPEAAVLPPVSRPVDVEEVARALFAREPQPGSGEDHWVFAAKLERLLRSHGGDIDPYLREVLLADAATRSPASADAAEARLRVLAGQEAQRPEALRALGRHLAERKRDFAGAAACFASAHARSGQGRDAYDAGRALYHVEPRAAFAWFDRIPEEQRRHHPRLALYEADRAESSGLRGDAIRPAYEALLGFYQGTEGRSLPFTVDVLARVAKAAGDEDAARRFGDIADAKRRSEAATLLRRARSLFEGGKLDDARRAADEAIRLAPADPRTIELQVRIAHGQRDAAGVRAGFAALRALAPSPELAVGAENRLRMTLGLALLPELGADALLHSRNEHGRGADGAGTIASGDGLASR